MKKIKITIVGAGSVIFGPAVAVDLLKEEKFEDCTISLVDTDKKKLETIEGVVKRIDEYFDSNFSIESSTDRRKVLPNSDFVIIMAEENRIDTWQKDWEIMQKFGINHPLAENRGPAGLSHTLRTVPLVLEICEDIEELCPESIAITLTNPEDRITYAASRFTDVKMYGYCDGMWDFKNHYLSELLDIPGERIYIRGAGINHCVWMTEILDRKSGENLYPKMIKKAKKQNWQPLSKHLYETYGLWPYENDEHVGEYIGYACEFLDCEGYDFEGHQKNQKEWNDINSKVANSNYSLEDYVEKVKNHMQRVFGDFPLSKIIKGISLGIEKYLPSINLQNNGKVNNLPNDMIVELPGFSTPEGIRGESFGSLPKAVTNFCYHQGVIQKLSAEAAAEGSKEKALKALILDEYINFPDKAEKLLDRFLEEHKDYVTSFE